MAKRTPKYRWQLFQKGRMSIMNNHITTTDVKVESKVNEEYPKGAKETVHITGLDKRIAIFKANGSGGYKVFDTVEDFLSKFKVNESAKALLLKSFQQPVELPYEEQILNMQTV